MPYEVFAEKAKALPKKYFDELSDYLEFLCERMHRQSEIYDEFARVREVGLESVRELTKDDVW